MWREKMYTEPMFACRVTKSMFIFIPVSVEIYRAITSTLKHLYHKKVWYFISLLTALLSDKLYQKV